MLDLLDIKPHLNLDVAGTPVNDVELLSVRDAALRLIEAHPDLRPEFVPLNTADPLMRFAVLELIRDMWQSTQSGGGGRTFGQDFAGDGGPVGTLGRPTLPPYVLGLLEPFIAHVRGPVGSFPAATAWSSW